MPDIEGLIAVIGAFSIAPAIVYLRNRHRIEEKKLELEAKTGGDGGKQTKLLADENAKLRERIENLESIVSSVDFELNQKVARLVDEHRSLMLPAGAPATPNASPAPASAPTADAKVQALDRTAPGSS